MDSNVYFPTVWLTGTSKLTEAASSCFPSSALRFRRFSDDILYKDSTELPERSVEPLFWLMGTRTGQANQSDSSCHRVALLNVMS